MKTAIVLGLILMVSFTTAAQAQVPTILDISDTTEPPFYDETDIHIIHSHPLYSMKKTLEMMEEKLAAKAEHKTTALLKVAARRAVEAKIAANHREDAVADELVEQYQRAMSDIDKLGPVISRLAKEKDIVALVHAARAHHITVLNTVLQKVGPSAKIGVQNAIASSSKVLNKTNFL